MHVGLSPVLGELIIQGGFISLWKLGLLVLVLLPWLRLLTWIDKDAVAARLPREGINSILFGATLAGFLLFLFLPYFFLAWFVLLLFFAGGFAGYLGIRKQRVGLKDFWAEFAEFRGGLFGGKNAAARKAAAAAPPGAVTFINNTGNPIGAPATESPDRLAYDALQKLLTDPLRKGAERIDLKPGPEFASVAVVVDGVAYGAQQLERHAAASAIGYLKRVAGLNAEELRKPQSGAFKIAVDGRKLGLEANTAGSTAGEFLRVLIEPKARHGRRLEELGMLPDQMEKLLESIKENTGIVLVTAPVGQGRTSMLYAILRAHDAFLTHIQSIERNPDNDIEGVTQNKLGVNALPADELKQVGWVISQQVDVIMIDEVSDPKSARDLIRFASDSKRVYIGMRAANVFDALAQWRKLVGDDALAMSELKMILAGRIMRRLCAACKLPYAPDPDTVRKLNLDPNRVRQLFQSRTQPMRNEKGEPIPCQFCQELHFKGRFGVYEMLIADDVIRKAVLSGGSEQQIKAAFRRQRGLFLQETALLQVEAGETSIQEVRRVLVGDGARPPARASASAGAG